MNKNINKHTFFQFIRFASVGVLNTLVSLATIYLLMDLLGVDYKLSNLIGYIVGVINSFFWTKLWVFRKSNTPILREAISFIIIFAICYAIQFGSLLFFVEKYLINEKLAQLLGMCIYTFLNFILNRCITFRTH